MKKPIIVLIALLLIAFTFAACTEEEMLDDSCPPSVMINGKVYYCFQHKTDIVPTEDDISGTIKSVC